MAYAYTPGLRVAEVAVLRKERILPLEGDVTTKVGDAVTAEQVVARTSLPGAVETVNVVNRLGIEAEDIDRYMLKKEGDAVGRNEPIAQSKSLFGLFKTNCPSPLGGTIEKISNVTGQVLIRGPAVPVEVKAYVDGKVVEVIEKEGAVIQTKAMFIQGIFGIGGERSGVLHMVAGSPSEIVEAGALQGDLAGKIIVCGSFVSTETVRRAMELGVTGIVTGGLSAKSIKDILGHDIGVAITGAEDIPITVVVTEGFGEIAMASRTFDLLKEAGGRKASISGATQIRAGVIRPEIIVPHVEHADLVEQAETEREALKVGDLVRIIREPHFGGIGTVTALPAELTKIETEASVRILEVELQDAGRVTIPRANVELIEK